jgi:prevent-host-death family protein
MLAIVASIAQFDYTERIERCLEIMTMDTLSANEAKTHFGDMLLKAQRAPIQINKNGKPVAVVISAEEYESIEALKLRLLQSRAAHANADIAAGNLVDGEAFFSELESGQHD